MIVKTKMKRFNWIGLESITFAVRPAFMALFSFLVINQDGAKLWGDFVYYLIGVELIIMLTSWGQKQFLMRNFSVSPNEINRSWNGAFQIRLLLVITLLLSVFFWPILESEKPMLLLWITFQFLISLGDALLPYLRKYKILLSSELFAALSGLTVYVVWRPNDIEGLMWILVLSSAIKAVFTLSVIIKEIKIIPFSLKIIKGFALPALPFFFLSFIGLIQNKADLYIVSFQMNESDLALYSIVLSFLILMQGVSAVMLRPFEKNIYRLRPSELSILKKKYLILGSMLSIIGATCVFYIVKLIYGFELNIEALPMLILYLLPFFFYLIEAHILLKFNLVYTMIGFAFLGAIAGSVTTWLLIPLYGIEGALLGGILSRLIVALFVVLRYRKLPKTSNSFQVT
jgi:O-antigen/teichoic acid export membrane protein|tara:strand:- start:801 stop:2000 length:1200 start_codon:yes stop_codon:yes gene_type:complete